MRWAKDYEEASVVRREIKPIREHLLCCKEGCGGEMVATGTAWLMSPQGYHHRCDTCGDGVAISGKSYPRIIYENV